tara:strand:- start:53 stop:508 length:456 start_codon:yes stop_codon:yes gene_type:complete
MLYKYLLYFILIIYSLQHQLSGFEYKSIKLITKKAYLRAGPGKWYPVKWILKVPGLPLKIIEENGDFNFVEIYDGTKGWISKTLISSKKNAVVIKDTYIYDKKGNAKALAKKNVIINVSNCNIVSNRTLCEVKNKKISGFISKDKIWGSFN